MNTRSLTVLAFVVAVASGLCGCGKSSSTASSANSAENYPLPDPPVVVDCHAGAHGGRFVISELGEPKTFNYLMSDDASTIDIGRFMFWGLLNFDMPSQTVKPGLADWWTNAPDGKTWTFHLRKNLRWSDGAPLTADDVLFTWNDVIYNTNFPSATRDPFIVDGKEFTVTKIDDQTIQVVTPEIYAPFLQGFGAGVGIYPKHILEKYIKDGTFLSAYGVNWNPSDIVGSGPYRLKEYKQAQYTVLERNPYFIEVDTNGTRLPYFDELVFAIVPNINALALDFLSGESDVDDYVYPFDYDKFKAEADAGKFTLLEPGIGLETSYFWFNENTNMNPKTGKPEVDPVKLSWFRNQKFRQAISYAVDREAILKSVYSGRGVVSYGFLTPGYQNWFDTNIQTYPYNPQKAVEMLKEIGIEKRNGDNFMTDSNGNKVQFVFNTNVENDARKRMSVLITGDLQKIGIDAVFQPVEFNTLITKIEDTHDYDCMLMGNYSDSGTDPSSSMNILKSSGYSHDWFPQEKSPVTPWEARIDQLMDDQMQTLDLGRREKDIDEVQEIMAEEQPSFYMVTPMYYAAIKSNIGNVRATALTYYRATWNAEELYYEK
ncbi:MAG TPA: ABC transporter substrate-binding protein [Verrucomicrobiae bacterium]|jgi:peptide/nickel transport system substrate-binding protein